MVVLGQRATAYLSSCLLAALSLPIAGCGNGTSAGLQPVSVPAVTPTSAQMIAPKQDADATSSANGSANKTTGSKLPPLSAGTVQGSAYMVVALDGVLAAATEGGGVLVSRDQGIHWQAMNRGLPSASDAIALVAAPEVRRLLALVSGQVYATRLGLPYAWTRWGRRLPSGTNLEALAFWPSTHTVLAGDGSGALYGAAAATADWQEADQGLPVGLQAITTLLARPGSIYAVGISKLWRGMVG